MWVIPNPSTENVIHGIEQTLLTYEHRRNEMFEMRDTLDWIHVCKTLNRYYENVLKVNETYDSNRTKQLYINAYV